MTEQEIIQMVCDTGYIVENTNRLGEQLSMTIAKDGYQSVLAVPPSIEPADMLQSLQWVEIKRAGRR